MRYAILLLILLQNQYTLLTTVVNKPVVDYKCMDSLSKMVSANLINYPSLASISQCVTPSQDVVSNSSVTSPSSGRADSLISILQQKKAGECSNPCLIGEIILYEDDLSEYCADFNSTITHKVVGDYEQAISIGNSQRICYNTRPNVLTSSIINSDFTVLSLQWQFSINGITWDDIEGANSASYQPGNLTKTTHFRKGIETVSHGVLYSNVAIITVRPDLKGGTIGNDQVINENSIPAIITGVPATGGSQVYDYVWQVSEDGGYNWFNIAVASEEFYQPEIITRSTLFKRQAIDYNCGIKYSNTVSISVQ